MTDIAELVAGNIDIWTGAIQRKSGAGRGGGKRISLYGIERLRALILDLAVRGKLVPQDAGDEPASELLKRIAKERSAKTQKVKAAKLKLDSDHMIGATARNPRGWITVPLREILLGNVGGGTPSKSDSRYWGGDIPWASVKDVGKAKYVSDTQDRITRLGLENSSANLVPAGNIIIVTRMGLGQLSINKIDLAINQDLRAIFVSANVDIDYCYNFFLTHEFEGSGMTVKGVKLDDLLSAPFPLPPLAEQQRIVAKVDDLMALCDALERESADAMAAHQVLVNELLATLVNSADAADLARQWALLESHFDTLFTTDASIDALKQTILELAVRGVLVAGMEAKEASKTSVALASNAKRSMSETEGLRARAPIARGKLARPEDTFPSRWTFTDFDSVFVTVSGVTKGQKVPASEAIDAPYLRVANVQRGSLDLLEVKTITVRQNDFERYQLRQGDVLMTEGGDWDKLGRAAIWRNEVPNCIHQNHVFRVRFEQTAILPEWVVLFVNSPLGREFFSRAAKQTTNLASINMTQLRSCPIPIPAYAEQRRIVAKVDALMALCDTLKARLADAAQTQRHLADAIIERAAA